MLLNIKLRDTAVQAFHFLERLCYSVPYPKVVLYIIARDEQPLSEDVYHILRYKVR